MNGGGEADRDHIVAPPLGQGADIPDQPGRGKVRSRGHFSGLLFAAEENFDMRAADINRENFHDVEIDGSRLKIKG